MNSCPGKFAVAIVLICFSAVTTLAQKKTQENYSSLKRRSSAASVSRLLTDANTLKESRPEEALDKVEEALAMSVAQKDEVGEGKCYLLIAQINEGISEWELALQNYSQAHQKLSSRESPEDFRTSLRGLGAMHLKLQQYNGALMYFNEALRESEGSEKYDCLLEISEVYFQTGKYDDALNALREIPDQKNVNSAIGRRKQNQEAKIYAKTREISISQALISNSLRSAQQGNPNQQEKNVDAIENRSLLESKDTIANALRNQLKYDDEISLRQEAVFYNLSVSNTAEVVRDKVEIGKSLEAKGNLKASLKELEEAAFITDTINSPKQRANAYLALAQSYERNGKSKLALNAYKNYSEAVELADKEMQSKMVQRTELINKQKSIEEISKYVSLSERDETIREQTLYRQELTIYGLLLIILIVAVTSFFIYRSARASRLANQLLALKSLRGQMNPHFIFNALNSVNQFISSQDERSANRFLSEFSLLMRLVLENSQEDFIPFQKEQEMLTLYLKLEHYRFRDKFDYEINVDEGLDLDHIEVPPMLTQPYIENAVWHGLRYKSEKGKLLLSYRKEGNDVVVEINDNGIGRNRSEALKTENQKKHKSTGLKNVRDRLEIINRVYHANYRVEVNDPKTGDGTIVRIYLPLRVSTI